MKKVLKFIFCLCLIFSFTLSAFSYSSAIKSVQSIIIKDGENNLSYKVRQNNNMSPYVIGDMTKVDNYGFINNLTSPILFGNNRYGTCSAVAGTILLKYYDEDFNHFLIPKTLTSATSKYNWSIDDNTFYCYIETINGNTERSDIEWDFDSSESINENTHRYLYYLMEELSGDGFFGTSQNNTVDGINNYISNIDCINNFQFTINEYENKNEIIPRLIDQNKPVISIIYDYETFDNVYEADKMHAVVVYGYAYNELTDQYYYLIHTGWQNLSNAIICENFFSDIIIYCASDMGNVSINHNEIYESTNSTIHTIRCSNCDYEIFESHQKQYAEKNPLYHYVTCSSCNYIATEVHQKQYTSVNSSTHNEHCSKCSYSANVSHNLQYDGSNSSNHVITCSDCGWSTTQAHQFTYSGISPQLHRKTCSICHTTTTEAHIFKGNKCRLCQYQKDWNDEILEDGGLME